MVLPGMHGLKFTDFVARVVRRIVDHRVTGTAAQLSYYFLLSLFPFLFFLVTLAAYLPLGGAVQELLGRLNGIVPKPAMDLVREHLNELFSNPRPRLLTLGLLFAIWSASRGVDALRSGLNLSYDVKESRSWLRVNASEILMTVVGTLLVLVAVAGFALGGRAGDMLASELHLERYYMVIWRWARWPATSLLVMFVAALAYYLLPDVKQEFKFITPGSFVGTLAWLVATWGFTRYVEQFGNYNATYGSIGGVIVLMTWLYISGLIFIVAGEINAIIEDASPEGKDRGARAKGEAPAPALDRPSAGQGKAGDTALLH